MVQTTGLENFPTNPHSFASITPLKQLERQINPRQPVRKGTRKAQGYAKMCLCSLSHMLMTLLKACMNVPKSAALWLVVVLNIRSSGVPGSSQDIKGSIAMTHGLAARLSTVRHEFIARINSRIMCKMGTTLKPISIAQSQDVPTVLPPFSVHTWLIIFALFTVTWARSIKM